MGRKAPNGVTELVTPGSVVCLPGEPVLLLDDNAVVVVGSGIARGGPRSIDGVKGEVLVATICGPLLCERESPGAPWSYSVVASGRYVPKAGDPVVGTVVRVLPLSYHVSLGGAHPATLDALAFDGATKSSRPRLRIGDHVYGHVVSAALDADTVVSCCAIGDMEAKEWTTGESVFGALQRGCVVRVATLHAKQLMREPCLILSLLGERVPFEIAVGANGRVWVRGATAAGAADPKVEQMRTIAVAACITEAQNDATSLDVQARVESYFPLLQKTSDAGAPRAAASIVSPSEQE